MKGEQRRRDYNWDSAGIDPAAHKFGAVDKDNYRDGVKGALDPESDPTIAVREPLEKCLSKK